MGSAHVFAYGSLLVSGAGAGVPCRLRGYRRVWNVAMDNTLDLPGYKFYVDPVTRVRPPVMVTFLNIDEDPAGEVNGVVVAVDRLEALDDRERNYARVDVRDLVSVELDGPVWAYVGLAEARRRYEAGLAEGRAVISREYLDGVIAAFRSLGTETLDEFSRTTVPPAVRVREFVRLALDAGEGRPRPRRD